MAIFDASLLRIAGALSALAIVFAVLFAISVIDVRTRRIPNALVGALIIVRLAILVIEGILGQADRALETFLGSLATALFFASLLLVLKAVMERVLQRDCVGLGDVKLVGAGCLYLSFDQAISAIGIASMIGILIAIYYRFVHKDRTFPFGPALCCGLFIALVLY
jgi:prepilin signal peptidase PulO-like enzyme (type II secretory pathway)